MNQSSALNNPQEIDIPLNTQIKYINIIQWVGWIIIRNELSYTRGINCSIYFPIF